MNKNETYFLDLKLNTQEIVKDLIIEYANSIEPCGWKDDEDCIKELECIARNGFIPNSENKGGLRYRNFTTLESYWGSGHVPENKDAAKEIKRQILYNEELAREDFKEKFKNKKPDINDDNYYELLCEYLNDDQSSIMHEIRFMYHGFKNKKHSASISVALNTEGPYHRSHISWDPEVFCEAAKEITFTWTNNKELKSKLDKHLKKLVKNMF